MYVFIIPIQMNTEDIFLDNHPIFNSQLYFSNGYNILYSHMDMRVGVKHIIEENNVVECIN